MEVNGEMTNLDRIKVLKQLKKHMCSSCLLPKEEEALNWAIKICEKYESRRRAKERQIYD